MGWCKSGWGHFCQRWIFVLWMENPLHNLHETFNTTTSTVLLRHDTKTEQWRHRARKNDPPPPPPPGLNRVKRVVTRRLLKVKRTFLTSGCQYKVCVYSSTFVLVQISLFSFNGKLFLWVTGYQLQTFTSIS